MPEASVRRRGVGNPERTTQAERASGVRPGTREAIRGEPTRPSAATESQHRHAMHHAGPTAHAVGLRRRESTAPTIRRARGCPRSVSRRHWPAEPGWRSAGQCRASGGQDARSERPASGCGQPRANHSSRASIRRRGVGTPEAEHGLTPARHREAFRDHSPQSGSFFSVITGSCGAISALSSLKSFHSAGRLSS